MESVNIDCTSSAQFFNKCPIKQDTSNDSYPMNAHNKIG